MANASNTMIVRVIIDDKAAAALLERDRKALERLGQTAERTGRKTKGVADFQGRTSKLSQGARGALSPFGNTGALLFGSSAFVGAAAAATALKATTQAASDLNEQITKSQQVFGDSADEILRWSKTTAVALGTSQEASLEAAGTFGNMFKSIHLGEDQSAELSRKLVQLAADLASFNNASPEDTFLALRAGLVGEAEPLRKFGVLLSEARVQQVALQQTGKQTVKQLTDQDKALARISIIFKDTQAAQGDFARTSKGLANEQRILSAEVRDLEANLGTLLLPTISKVVEVLGDAAIGANEVVEGLKKIGTVKIPSIHIPFVFDTPGGTLGGFVGKAAGKAFDVAKFTPFNPFLIETIALKIADQFKEGAEGQTPKLAAEFSHTLNGFFQSALDQSAEQVKPPTAPAGFGTGLTPKDLYGPLILQLSNKLNEALLDVQIKNPNNHKAIIDVLVRQREELQKDLEDPRLKVGQRVSLKEKLKSVESSIDSENAAIQQAIDDTNTKRQKAIDDAKQKADDARQKQRDAFDNLIASLELQLDQAKLTRGFADDKAKVAALQKAVQAQIAVEGKTPELLRQLFDLRNDASDIVDQETTQRQFRKLGLSVTGEDIIPGEENLRKQFASLSKRLKVSGKELGSKLATEFRLAGKALKDPLEKLKPEVRSKIQELFKTVRDTFNDEQNKPLTANSAFQANKLLEGLGLSPEAEKLIRQRVSRANTRSLGVNAPGLNLKPSAVAFTGGGSPVVVHSEVTVNLDGQTVARNTRKHNQKDARRNPRQKRGPNRNI